jgi:endonuclease/exonuclease/phosphatase family metal-dependent hydrolase
MRSEYVFAAAREIGNRFMLCRVTSVSVRRLHIDSTQPSETINKSLQLIAAGDANNKPSRSADAVAAGDTNNQPDSPRQSDEAVTAG